jgi:hypothetical protein
MTGNPFNQHPPGTAGSDMADTRSKLQSRGMMGPNGPAEGAPLVDPNVLGYISKVSETTNYNSHNS